VNGLAVDFFDTAQLGARIEEALQQPQKMQKLRNAARATAVERFDLKRVVLPKWLALFEDLTKGRRPRQPEARMSSRRQPARRGRGQAAG
jgi:glycosyltransferase involved in cell wall biosynthesis